MSNSKPVATAPATNGKAVSIQNPEKVVSLKKVEETPLEKSLQHIKKLVELQARHSRLLQSEQKLDQFRMEKGEENIELELNDENSRGVDFATKNPEVIAVVIDVLRATIQTKRKEVEAQLLAAA